MRRGVFEIEDIEHALRGKETSLSHRTLPRTERMNAEEITPLRLLAPHSSGPSDDEKSHSAIRTNAHGHIFTDFCELCLVCENAYGMHADKRMCVYACVLGVCAQTVIH